MNFAKAADRPIVAMENFGFHGAAARGHQGPRGRGEPLERTQLDRCLAQAGAPSGNHPVGHHRIQARLKGERRSPLVVGNQRRRVEFLRTAALHGAQLHHEFGRAELKSARHMSPKISTMRAAHSSASWFDILRTEAVTASSPRKGGTPLRACRTGQRIREPLRAGHLPGARRGGGGRR